MTPPRNLVLIGLRATGKTTLGRALAARLGWQFFDTDTQLEARFEQPIADVFTELGEAKFRQHEAQVVRDLADSAECVISTGGGTILRGENRRRLQALGPCIWLDAPIDVMRERMQATPGTRPALHGTDPLTEIAQVSRERAPLYAALAELHLDTSTAGVDELVEQVCDHVGIGKA